MSIDSIHKTCTIYKVSFNNMTYYNIESFCTFLVYFYHLIMFCVCVEISQLLNFYYTLLHFMFLSIYVDLYIELSNRITLY